MNIMHLRSFIITVDEGSITKASARLYITPPSLHQQLALLENEVGCRLLIRNNKGVTPTPAGRIIYTTARNVIVQLEQSMEEARRTAMSYQPLRIGYFDAADLFFVEEFMKEYPDVKVELTVMDWQGISDLYGKLENGKLDLTFSEVTSRVSEHNCLFLPVKKDHVAVLMSPSHPLSKKKTLTRKDLEGKVIYINGKDSPVLELKEKIQLKADFVPIEEKSENIVSLCYQGGLFIGENQYLRKSFPLKVRSIIPKKYIYYGILYSRDNRNPNLLNYLDFAKKHIPEQ